MTDKLKIRLLLLYSVVITTITVLIYTNSNNNELRNHYDIIHGQFQLSGLTIPTRCFSALMNELSGDSRYFRTKIVIANKGINCTNSGDYADDALSYKIIKSLGHDEYIIKVFESVDGSLVSYFTEMAIKFTKSVASECYSRNEKQKIIYIERI